MSIVVKATEDSDIKRSSSAYIVIPVAGDDHNPTMEEQYSSTIIEDTGDFSLSPPIELVVTDEDTFPVDADYSFTLKGDQLNLFAYVLFFILGEGKEFFVVNKDASDNSKATIDLNKDSFDSIDALPEAGQLSFFVEVFSFNQLMNYIDLQCSCLFLGLWNLWHLKAKSFLHNNLF